MKIKVLSYNIHKGVSSFGTKFILDELKKNIALVKADVVFLQEVHGHHEDLSLKTRKGPTQAQFEYLADEVWHHYSYGKNAVYKKGHHGNAILSNFPIVKQENINISTNRLEKRGMLHCEIIIPELNKKIHLINLHLNLLESSRDKQSIKLVDRVNTSVAMEEPLIVAGDFNDWREVLTNKLENEVKLNEVFQRLHGKHPKTYPSLIPMVSLDRMFYRNVTPISATVLNSSQWKKLSDHLAIVAEFEV